MGKRTVRRSEEGVVERSMDVGQLRLIGFRQVIRGGLVVVLEVQTLDEGEVGGLASETGG